MGCIEMRLKAPFLVKLLEAKQPQELIKFNCLEVDKLRENK